jgi:hypothetical protein
VVRKFLLRNPARFIIKKQPTSARFVDKGRETMGFKNGGFGRHVPKPFMSTEEGKQAILTACKEGASYQSIDFLLQAVNDAAEGKQLSRQDAHSVLRQLREEGLIARDSNNIRAL